MYKIKTKGKGKKIVKLFRKLGYGIQKDETSRCFDSAEYIFVNTRRRSSWQITYCLSEEHYNKQSHEEITYNQLNQMVRDKEETEMLENGVAEMAKKGYGFKEIKPKSEYTIKLTWDDNGMKDVIEKVKDIPEIDYDAIKKEAKDRFVGLQEDIVALDREIELQLQQKIINLEHKLKDQKDISQIILKHANRRLDKINKLRQEIKDKDKIIIRQKEEIEELRLGL